MTDAELRAASVPVSGPLTDVQLRATAVPVSGPLTDAELRAAAVPVTVTGVATAAKQDAQTALLTTIDASATAIAASTTILDDWDETDRAKVNVIVGQAGIAAGAGAVGVTVPRVTLASDDPAVVSLSTLDDWDESDRAKVNTIVGQAGVAAGSGTVSAATQRMVLATDVGLPAGSALLGKASVGMDTDALYQGATARTVGRAIIDAATSGDNTLLAAQGVNNKIRVHSLFLVAAGAVNVRFESGAGGTALTGQMNLIANTGFVLPFNPLGWFETAANTLLNLELSGAVSVDGSFQYSVVQ